MRTAIDAPVRQWRIVRDHIGRPVAYVWRGNIIGTDTLTYHAYEPAQLFRSHSTTTSLNREEYERWPDVPRGSLGDICTRSLPPELEALPYGEERMRLVSEYHAMLAQRASAFIKGAFPEARAAEDPRWPSVTIKDVGHQARVENIRYVRDSYPADSPWHDVKHACSGCGRFRYRAGGRLCRDCRRLKVEPHGELHVRGADTNG